jgi:CRP/FNR family transcriptional regulator, cyclic AMP receptor protein
MNAAFEPPRLRDAVLHEIATQGIVKRFPARTVLISEGDVANTLFIILEGRVKVHAADDDGKEVTFGTLGPGEYVGEFALDGGRRDASVTTVEPTTCAVVAGAKLREFVVAHPDFAIHLIYDLIGRVRAMSRNVKSLALEDVYRRVVGLLMRLAKPEGTTLVVRERLTQRDIAERIGSSREMVSRVFKELTVGGYLEVRGGIIFVLKKLPSAW